MGEPGDVRLLGRELVAGVVAAFAHLLARGQQLAAGALGEPFHADPVEQLVRGSQLRPRIDASMLAAQPLAVEEVGAGELGTEWCAAEPADRLLIARFGLLVVAEEARDARLDAACPVGVGGARGLREPLERSRAELGLPGPDARFDDLGQRPGGDEEPGRLVARDGRGGQRRS